MNCRICKDKITKENRRISIFDYETIICRQCNIAEQIAHTSKRPEVRDVVHFAHVIKDFELWKLVVSDHRMEAEECCDAM